MTVADLVSVLDDCVTFEVIQSYKREILYESDKADCIQELNWDKVKEKTVCGFYPIDGGQAQIYVSPRKESLYNEK